MGRMLDEAVSRLRKAKSASKAAMEDYIAKRDIAKAANEAADQAKDRFEASLSAANEASRVVLSVALNEEAICAPSA